MYVIWVNRIVDRLAYIFSSPEIQRTPAQIQKEEFKTVCLLVAVGLIVVIGGVTARHLARQIRPSYPILAIAYVGIVLAASLLAGSEYPSLPVVQFYGTNPAEQDYGTTAAAQDYQFSPDPYTTLSRPTYVVLSSKEELWYVIGPAEGVVAIPIQHIPVTEFHGVNEVYAGTYKIETTCQNFDSREYAQRMYEALVTEEERARLDPDNDDIACEELEN